jgi:hypothetical protein
MLKIIQKSLLLFACAIFVSHAKITFKSSELQKSVEEEIRKHVQGTVRQFSRENKQTKKQCLNLTMAGFMGLAQDSELPEGQSYREKYNHLTRNLTREAYAFRNQSDNYSSGSFNDFVETEIEKGWTGYFGSTPPQHSFDKRLITLYVIYDSL